MLDEFHWCHVNRISPEAPVPICKIKHTTLSPGGAANVAANLASLQANVDLCGFKRIYVDLRGLKWIYVDLR